MFPYERSEIKSGWAQIQDLRPSTQLVLVDQTLFLGADAFAEHVIRPALVDENYWNEDQGNDGHDSQRISRGGSVVNCQVESRVDA